MKLYTEKGDFGETCFISEKVKKSDERILCLGAIDETSAAISVARTELEDIEMTQYLLKIEKKLSKIAGIIAGKPYQVPEEEIKKIQELIDKYYTKQEGFLRPKTEEGALLNYARTVCRRAEFYVNKLEEVPEGVLKYMNRLSDLLFAMAVYSDEK